MISRSLRVLNTLGTAAGALSLILLIDCAINVSWVEVLWRILDYYRAIKTFVFSPLEPLLIDVLRTIEGVVNLHLQLLPHWSDVFVLLFLYFGARARTYWDAGLRGRSVFRYIYGALTAIITAVISGIVPQTSVALSVLMVSTTLFGIMMFEVGDCSWSATFARKSGLTWSQDFKRYAAFSFPPLYLNIALLLVGVITARYLFQYGGKDLGLILLFVFAFVLACYWIFRGWLSSANFKEYASETRWKRFQQSSNTRIGMLMLGSIFGALIFILLNAGLGYVGL